MGRLLKEAGHISVAYSDDYYEYVVACAVCRERKLCRYVEESIIEESYFVCKECDDHD